MDAFLYVIFSCGTVSSFNNIPKKTTLAVWRRMPHITPLLYKVYLPITERLVETEALCLLYKLLGIGHLCKHSSTFSYVNEARKHLLVFVIDRYVTFHHRSSLIPACIVCSKLSWWCMGSLGSTAPTVSLRWGWGEDERVDWILLWTEPPEVTAVCLGLTKCNCKRAVPVTVVATKPH